jgi:hypothetical protein
VLCCQPWRVFSPWRHVVSLFKGQGATPVLKALPAQKGKLAPQALPGLQVLKDLLVSPLPPHRVAPVSCGRPAAKQAASQSVSRKKS